MANGRLTRREWLRVGGLIGAGPWLSGIDLNSARAAESSDAAGKPGFGKAKSVIVVFASGGQSQLDTWDPKPEAPAEVRGIFESIPTAVPGTRLCEHMPRIAKVIDRCTIVRSMSHEDLDHGSAVYLSLTGEYHQRKSSNPPARPTDTPAYSSVFKRLRPPQRFIDSAIHVNAPAIVAPNDIAPGQFGGFLGREFDPTIVGDVTRGPIVMPGLAPRDDLPAVRLEARKSLLQTLEGHSRRLVADRSMSEMNVHYRQAFKMLADPKTRNAFDLSQEPEQLRNRYGRNRSGQACLLARRLVEADVPLVTVIWNHQSRGQDNYPDQTDFYGWDTHNDIFESLKMHLLPRFDLSFSALIEDLEQRGLLETTLVVCMGEFGRAPLVALEPRFKGATPGRKHWASTYSIVLAGAGVGRGKILGKSDRLGAHPAAMHYGPWDLTATIFSALGIDPSGYFSNAVGLVHQITRGLPMTGLYTG